MNASGIIKNSEEKEAIIRLLMDDDIKHMRGEPPAYILTMLRDGFKGYSNMSLNNLRLEAISRQIPISVTGMLQIATIRTTGESVCGANVITRKGNRNEEKKIRPH